MRWDIVGYRDQKERERRDSCQGQCYDLDAWVVVMYFVALDRVEMSICLFLLLVIRRIDPTDYHFGISRKAASADPCKTPSSSNVCFVCR
jgi:hypothetical protein